MAAPSDVERIKANSRHLRGTLADSLADPLTGALADDDTQLSKFHGIYQQDDRDSRSERRRQRLEPDYSFMIRARVPAGVCTTAQWLDIDRLATGRANGSIRLTTRQAIQLHGVIKQDLKPAIAAINHAMLDTLAACGDVNRNVMAPTLVELTPVHREVERLARELSDQLTPATRAYHEIWLDGEKLPARGSTDDEVEPLYGDTYLPRKFKSAFVVPPQNDVDVFAQDLGFIAIVEDGELAGFNVVAGGGMGMTHGERGTQPLLGRVIGFCRPEQVPAVAEAIVTTQRDHGDRSDRRHARLKYTIADGGLDWFRGEVESRIGYMLDDARPFRFLSNGDVYGWQRDADGRWHYLLFVENGRVADRGSRRLMSGLRAIAARHAGEFRLTPNQNIAISGVTSAARPAIDALLDEFGIANDRQATPLRRHSLACVALPTCALAMAESERYLPSLVDRIDVLMAAAGLAETAVTIRMTGCPNGCARPYIAEIGLVGKAPGRYNLFLGAGFAGDRVGRLYLDNADESTILATLGPLLERYAAERQDGERFGDFLLRSKVVSFTGDAADVHDALAGGATNA